MQKTLTSSDTVVQSTKDKTYWYKHEIMY